MAKIDGRTLNHKSLEHIRILAVKRVIEDKEAPSEVMKSLGLDSGRFMPLSPVERYQNRRKVWG